MTTLLRNHARPARMGAASLAVALVMWAFAPSAVATLDAPSLWKKTYQASLVVRVTVLDGDNRMAVLEVNEVIKGQYDREQLKVVFRAVNWSRDLWEDRIVFPESAPLVLFLRPFIKKGKVNARDQFELVGGYHGIENVPPEGNEAYLQAIRRFVTIQSLQSQLAIWEQARALLKEDNPYLVQAGFDQVLRFRLANEALVPVLLEHMDDPSVGFRTQSVQCLGDVLKDARRDDKVLMGEDHLRDLLLFTATNDTSVSVRVEAIRALEAGGDIKLVPTFRRIAREDPSQAVRYQAERTLFEIQGGAKPAQKH